MKYLLLVAIIPVALLSGCITGGVGSADFDLGEFFGNPLVIVAVLALIIWMWSRGRK